jgi:hypothetical protein
MSRILFKKKSPQHSAVFRQGHPGLKHGKQAWEKTSDGTRSMRFYNAHLPEETPWDERWVDSPPGRTKKVRHYPGERVSPVEDTSRPAESMIIGKTEKVGHRPDPRRHPGASGFPVYA